MPKSRIVPDLIAIAPSVALAFQHSRSFQICQNPLHGAFRNAHLLRQITHPQLCISRQANQYMGMIG